MIELLAPAGNEKSFFSAINNGANAVYIGLSDFSARKNADNFNTENLKYYISYAHLFNVKVYVAVNTLVKDCELDKFYLSVKSAYEAGADAFILQDVFLSQELLTRFPDIILHLSTQGGVNNIEGAKFAVSRGFSRVILARETQIEEVKKIAEIVETEVFVHGAMCSCFSGHCYLSSFVGGNSGNRGYCKQPCRKKYSIETKIGKGEYSISLSDLNLADDIAQLKDAGVASVKIEGRMRTPEYVAGAVRLYRAAIDSKPYNFDEIKREFNRGNYTKGYIYGIDKNIISDKVQSHIGESVGKVYKILDNNKCKVVSREKFVEGDGFKILRNGYEVGNAVAIDKNNILSFKGNISVGDEACITKDLLLNEKLNKITKLKPLNVIVKAVVGEHLTLSAEDITVESEELLEKAKTAATTEKDILDNLLKTDKYPFSVNAIIKIDGEPFIAKSQLNKLRSLLYYKIFYKSEPKRICAAPCTSKKAENQTSVYNRIIISDRLMPIESNEALVYFPDNYDEVIKPQNKDRIYLYVPSFLNSCETNKILQLSEYFYGFYVDGLNGLKLSEESNKHFIAGMGLNAFNATDIEGLYSLHADAVVFSKELSLKEIAEIGYDGNIFSAGAIRLTEFIYCPFGKKCSECKRGNRFKVKDETGHYFILRRYKINGQCRFELYNGAVLSSSVKNKNIVNLILSDKDIQYMILNDISALNDRVNITAGNLKRGVR